VGALEASGPLDELAQRSDLRREPHRHGALEANEPSVLEEGDPDGIRARRRGGGSRTVDSRSDEAGEHESEGEWSARHCRGNTSSPRRAKRLLRKHAPVVGTIRLLSRIAVIGPSGSGKTRLASELAAKLGAPHVEIDALFHGPNWESVTLDVLRERVDEATSGADWISDGTYHQLIGELVLERAEAIAWLDLPVRLVVWRLLRRTYVRKKHDVELWHGNREGPWPEILRYLVWPACKRGFANRWNLPALFARHTHLRVYRLRSDHAVRDFVASFGS
jgi:adenylate kinase family enzyme